MLNGLVGGKKASESQKVLAAKKKKKATAVVSKKSSKKKEKLSKRKFLFHLQNFCKFTILQRSRKKMTILDRMC